MNSAKIKRVIINPEVFFEVMKNKSAWKVENGIPTNAKLRGMNLDPNTQNLILFIDDESFDSIDPTKTVAPLLEVTFKKIV